MVACVNFRGLHQMDRSLRWFSWWACIGWLALAPPAGAVTGTHDNVPAATLLLPYFEVDLGNPDAITTVFSVSNASATAALANVTLWSTEGVSVLNFNVYLTGYDLQPVSLRDVLNGVLPRTASAGQDPADTISPKGPLSQDVNFASCTGVLPPPASLSAAEITDLQMALTGRPIPGQGNLCASANQGDNVARGYVTVDAVSACTALDPDEAGYSGVITRQNIFFGDWAIVHPQQNFSSGDLLVAIEAGTNAALSTPGNYTFYGRYNGGSAADRREPLGLKWAQPRVNESPGVGQSALWVWRDNKRVVMPFNCAGGASAVRIAAGQAVDHDPLGNQMATATAGQMAPQASQRLTVTLGSGNSNLIEVGSKTGWLELDLNHALPSGNLFGNSAQSFPVNVMGGYTGAQGRYQTSAPPLQLEVPAVPPTGAGP